MDRPTSAGARAALTAIAPAPQGIRLRVRVQPRASRTELMGLQGDEIRIRVAAPPVDGAANDVLVRFLADIIGVARSAVTVIGGAGSRSKVVSVTGVTPAQAGRRLGLVD